MKVSEAGCDLHDRSGGVVVICDVCHTGYCNLCDEILGETQKLTAWPFMALADLPERVSDLRHLFSKDSIMICGFCMYGDL